MAGARRRAPSRRPSPDRSRLRSRRSHPPDSARWMKSFTIALDGSTYTGSVAVLRGDEVICERTLGGSEGGVQRSGRGESLMPAIAECVREAGIGRADIARIVCGAGPGSFTSLRVAGSVAKGLAVGYG